MEKKVYLKYFVPFFEKKDRLKHNRIYDTDHLPIGKVSIITKTPEFVRELKFFSEN